MAGLDDYKGTLPYASELFGIYQPLLGWRSKRIIRRYERARLDVYRELADRMLSLKPDVSVAVNPALFERRAGAAPAAVAVQHLKPLRFPRDTERYIAPKIDSAVARVVSERLDVKPPEDW